MPTYVKLPSRTAYATLSLPKNKGTVMGQAGVSGNHHYRRKGDSLANMAWSRSTIGKIELVKVGPRIPKAPTMAEIMPAKLRALANKYAR